MPNANAKSMIARFSGKSTFAKSMLAALGAGALLFAAPAKSNAQVVVAARPGRPEIVVAARRTPYEVRRREEIRREEIRHEEWLRAHRFDRDHYGYYR